MWKGLYTVGVVFMFPAMVMAMAAGAVFGMVAGTTLAWLGSCVGQIIAFVIGRYLLREMVLTYLTRQFPNWSGEPCLFWFLLGGGDASAQLQCPHLSGCHVPPRAARPPT